MVIDKSFVIGSLYVLIALMIFTSLMISSTVGPESVSVEGSKDIVDTEFLGEVYVFDTSHNNTMELSLNKGYKSSALDLTIYYTNSTGLNREGFGGGSSSMVSKVNESEIYLEGEDEKVVDFDDNHVVALVKVNPNNHSVYPENRGHGNFLHIFLFLGLLLFFVTAFYYLSGSEGI